MGTINTVVATINGVQVELTEGSGGVWSASTTAPNTSSFVLDPQYYNVSIAATDMATNSTTIDATDATFGDNLKLVVKETTAPVISVSAPSEGAYVSEFPTLTASLTDSGSGIDASSLVLTYDGNTVSSDDYTLEVVSQTSTGTIVVTEYALTYTPTGTLENGQHTFVLNVKDNDGNDAAQVTRNFNALVSAPDLAITTPAEDGTWSNTAANTISGTTDASATLKVAVDGGEAVDVTVGSEGTWSYTSNALADGEHTFTFTATGLSGLTTTATRTLNVDTVAPTITAVSITPNPADNGETLLISVTVQD